MPLIKLAEAQEPVEQPDPTAAVVVFQGYISETSVNELLADLNDSVARGVKEILVSFTTPGGEIAPGFRLYDELRKIAGQVELSTHAFQLVASMGVAVYLAGDKRTIGPEARILLHAASNRFDTGQQLTAAQMRHLAELMDGQDGREREIVVERTGLSEDEARALVDGSAERTETIIAATDAVDKGFSTDVQPLMFGSGVWYSQLGPYAAPE